MSPPKGTLPSDRLGKISMAKKLPYLTSYKNVGTLFAKIQEAKAPSTFTHAYLSDTLGLKSSSDRALVALLRDLGFLDGSNKPTKAYGELKNETMAKQAIARGVQLAYKPLFEANENAHALSAEATKGLIAQVAGTDSKMTDKIYYTFNALKAQAKFEGGAAAPPLEDGHQANKDEASEGETPPPPPGKMRPEFHYNIQVHLPANESEDTYLNIFNAIRKAFS